jgi:hypothetical protein
VLSLPFELRYRLTRDHELCRAVLAVHTRALFGFYRKRAGASGRRDGRTGTVTVIQRFAGALNLNVHFHTLAVDGMFVREPNGSLRFVAAKAPSNTEIEALLAVIRKRVLRLLVRRGLLSEEPGESSDESEAPPLHALYAASVRQFVNLIVYHGVLAPNAKWRREVVDFGRPRVERVSSATTPKKVGASYNRTWAELMRRGLDIDVLECPDCGERLRFVAAIMLSSAIHRILRHLGLPSDPVELAPARAPPELDDAWAC